MVLVELGLLLRTGNRHGVDVSLDGSEFICLRHTNAYPDTDSNADTHPNTYADSYPNRPLA